MLNSKTIVNLLKIELSKYSNIEFGYLFGSYADGSFTNKSDVDIALFLNNCSFDTELELHFKLSKTLNKDVDLVILNKAKNLYLLDDIFQKGLVLKDSEKRIDYEIRKQHQIFDYKEFKRRIGAA